MESCYIDVIEVITNNFNFDLLNVDQITGCSTTPTLLAGAGEGELKLGYKLETLGYKY